MPADAVISGITAALSANNIDPAVVLIEARRHSATETPAIPIGADLARFDRPAPTLKGYDDLLEAR
jgi:hypothetical protein